jgi:hypothetical protein
MILAKKRITQDTWSQIKGKYVSGTDPIYRIAQHHDINKKSIERRAKKEGWVYGSESLNVAQAIEKATIETIIKEDTDKSVRLTEIFLKDATNLRNITMAIMGAMAEELKKSGGHIATAEANRLLSCQRVSEVANKTITNLYTSTRKALGMDREEEMKRTAPKLDPAEGMTEYQIEDKIAELQQ